MPCRRDCVLDFGLVSNDIVLGVALYMGICSPLTKNNVLFGVAHSDGFVHTIALVSEQLLAVTNSVGCYISGPYMTEGLALNRRVRTLCIPWSNTKSSGLRVSGPC